MTVLLSSHFLHCLWVTHSYGFGLACGPTEPGQERSDGHHIGMYHALDVVIEPLLQLHVSAQ